ncbi:MAG: response regulator [Anaerolineales bacterium]|nr:response regulator [Anaerolineales bacterium]
MLQVRLAADAADASALPMVEADLVMLRQLFYASIAAGCVGLFALLMLVFWRDWQTIRRQQADLVQTNADLRAANRDLLTMAKFPDENPHLMLRLNPRGEVLYANMAALRVLGQGGEVVTPPAWQEAAQAAMADGEQRELEYGHDGLLLACTFVPLPDLDYVSVYAIDITRRRTAEDALQQAEETSRTEREALLTELSRLTTIIETTSDFVAMFTLEGDILYVNPAGMAMVGRLGEAYRQLAMADFQPAEVAAQMQDSIFPLVRKYEVWSGESALLHVDGTAIPVSQVITLIRNKRSEPIAIGTVARDITERKQNEQRLQRAIDTAQKAQYAAEEAQRAAEEASQAKTTFLANMSHELRTPLNAIIGYSEMLGEEAEERGLEPFTSDLRRIYQAGQHLLALISDVLDLSKIEAGRMPLYVETFDLPALIDSIVVTVEPLVARNNNTLTSELLDVEMMHADKTKVRQILYNLLSNAAKFTQRGRIQLRVRREPALPEIGTLGDWIVFEVSDTGIGMAPDQIEELFQPFTQGDSSSTRQYEGTGLGLSISRRFCQMMGGEIFVESALGVGSSFAAYLPARVDSLLERPLPPSAGRKPVVKPAPEAKPHPGADVVLVIDDDPIARDLIRRQLNRAGYHVFTASNGEEGLQLASQLQPDVITLDVLIPEMSGWTVLSRLKQQPELAEIPVILVTMVDDKYTGFAMGADDYLMKPVDRAQLLRVLERHDLRGDVEVGRRVLIVEDDEASRALLARTLAKRGWRVTEAENGRVALDRIVESTPDIILLDLMMPEMDGFQFIEELRRQPDWDRIPVIVTTAKELTVEEQQLLHGHVERIVQKGRQDGGNLLRQITELVTLIMRRQHRV